MAANQASPDRQRDHEPLHPDVIYLGRMARKIADRFPRQYTDPFAEVLGLLTDVYEHGRRRGPADRSGQ